MTGDVKQLFIGVCILIGSVLPDRVTAQSAGEFFVNMPHRLLPSLDAGKRQDMIDYFESGRSDKVRNDYGGLSYLAALAPSYLCLATSERGTLQLKVITRADSSVVIAVIHTVCTPACDSRVAFYDATWASLPTARFITLPTPKMWCINAKKTIPKHLQPDAWYYTLTANDKENQLEARLTLETYLSGEQWRAIAPLLKEKISCLVRVK